MDLDKHQILNYLTSSDEKLFVLADSVRKDYVGDEVYLRGLIEISNICKQNCFYCGIRNQNKFCDRYRLSEEEIMASADMAVELGYKTVVLQAGEDDFLSPENLKNVFEYIKSKDLVLTLSLGEKSYEDYLKYKDFGADRYLLRIETTDKNLYKKLHPKMSFENRVNCLKNLKKLGYELGTGSLIGLPEQSLSSIADDIVFFKEIGADMVGVGPFLPTPNTPLENSKQGSLDLTLKVVALTRILLKDVNIPATTALETLSPNGRILGLKSGANVIMPNVTDIQYKQKYSIYPNKSGINLSVKALKDEVIRQIESIGRTVLYSKGFRRKN